MKRIIKYIVATIAVCFICTSCFTTMALLSSQDTGSDISKERTYLDLKILRTFNSKEALAYTEHADIVKIETQSDTYYDGKKISGNFTLVGTYTYQAKNEMIKTVPVYVLTSEYNKHKEYWK